EIAAELTRLGASPYVTAAKDHPPEGAPKEDALKIIFKLLRSASGVDFTGYRQSTIQRRIQRRIAVRRREGIEDYVKLMEENPEEIQALFSDILIHVTNFFRVSGTFAALATQVFPELLKKR